VLFVPREQWGDLLGLMGDLDFSGKTVIGGLAGGFIAVELAKKALGVTASTGDGFAVALPLSQAVGRVGCFLEGCCYGRESGLPWAIAGRQPAQLYEAVGLLMLAGFLFAVRERPRPAGVLFRMYLCGYAVIRFAVDCTRGDPAVMLGPLRASQWVCLAAAIGFGVIVLRADRVTKRGGEAAGSHSH